MIKIRGSLMIWSWIFCWGCVPNVFVRASLHGDGDSAEVIFNIPPPSSAPESISRVDIVGSCIGFILLYYFVIWNPSTGFHKRINNVSSTCDYVERLFGIGHGPSTDDYVVLIVTVSSTKVYCFSLRTNLWSLTKDTVPHYIGFQPSHGLYCSWMGLFIGWWLNPMEIVAWLLHLIWVSDSIANGLDYKTYHLMVMRGFLCICFMSFRTVLWIMKDYKAQSSWTWTKSFVMSTSYFPVRYPFFPDMLHKKCGITIFDLNSFKTEHNF